MKVTPVTRRAGVSPLENNSKTRTRRAGVFPLECNAEHSLGTPESSIRMKFLGIDFRVFLEFVVEGEIWDLSNIAKHVKRSSWEALLRHGFLNVLAPSINLGNSKDYLGA